MKATICYVLGLLTVGTQGFQAPAVGASQRTKAMQLLDSQRDDIQETSMQLQDRRNNLQQIALSIGLPLVASPQLALAEDFEARNAERKYVQESYEDFTKSKEGWLYREIKPGNGEVAKEGDRVVFDWSGYTIG